MLHPGIKRDGEPVHLSSNPTNIDALSWEMQKITTSLVQSSTVKGFNCGKRGHWGRSAQCSAHQSQC